MLGAPPRNHVAIERFVGTSSNSGYLCRLPELHHQDRTPTKLLRVTTSSRAEGEFYLPNTGYNHLGPSVY